MLRSYSLINVQPASLEVRTEKLEFFLAGEALERGNNCKSSCSTLKQQQGLRESTSIPQTNKEFRRLPQFLRSSTTPRQDRRQASTNGPFTQNSARHGHAKNMRLRSALTPTAGTQPTRRARHRSRHIQARIIRRMEEHLTSAKGKAREPGEASRWWMRRRWRSRAA